MQLSMLAKMSSEASLMGKRYDDAEYSSSFTVAQKLQIFWPSNGASSKTLDTYHILSVTLTSTNKNAPTNGPRPLKRKVNATVI